MALAISLDGREVQRAPATTVIDVNGRILLSPTP
jgi:hypothetical protein